MEADVYSLFLFEKEHSTPPPPMFTRVSDRIYKEVRSNQIKKDYLHISIVVKYENL